VIYCKNIGEFRKSQNITCSAADFSV